MAEVHVLNYKGKTIIFADYKGCASEEEMIQILYQTRDQVVALDKEYYQLSDITGVYLTPKYIEELKKIAKNTPQKAVKRAEVGVQSFSKKNILKGYNLLINKNGLKPFDDLQTAKDWLVN